MPVKIKSRPKIKDKLGKHGQPLKVTTGYYLSDDVRAALKKLATRCRCSTGDVAARLVEFAPQVQQAKAAAFSQRVRSTHPKRRNTSLTMLASQHRKITGEARRCGVARESLVDFLVETFGGLL